MRNSAEERSKAIRMLANKRGEVSADNKMFQGREKAQQMVPATGGPAKKAIAMPKGKNLRGAMYMKKSLKAKAKKVVKKAAAKKMVKKAK